MSLFEKIGRALKKMKSRLIVYAIVIVLGIIVLVAPISMAITDALNTGSSLGDETGFEALWDGLMSYLPDPFGNLSKVFTTEYASNFFTGTFWFVVFALLFIFVGVYKALPKNEFSDIENGSSDWATGGEQYRVLSKKTGIILAEKNYLPVDKRGNVNVLVVRRFWCW
jgi:hypothetical protein